MGKLILLALSTFISEDLACFGAAALIAMNMMGFVEGTVACGAGIFFGDLLLYAMGRLGRTGFHLSEARLQRASEWIQAKGPSVIFLSRFTPGLRLPTYVAAGLLKFDFGRFTLYLLVAAALWTPGFIGLALLFGMHSVRALPVLAVLLFAAKYLASWRNRRLLIGWWKRRTRWEFWPIWAVYLPLTPYLLWLAVKHRSWSAFVSANPGFPAGAIAGESKISILDGFTDRSRIAKYRLIQGDVPETSFPVVLKPDIGERGKGVAVVRSREELEGYLRTAQGPTILQEYVPGVEFGVFYCAFPGASRGQIFSITAKTFPVLYGDGRRTVEELILADGRAVCLAARYRTTCRRDPASIPTPGEPVQLCEIGSHSRGSIFLDAGHLLTPELEAEVDRVSRSHPGFYFGRYDMRSESIEAFQRGEFTILELNGVTSEATHIYDPSISVIEAYRVLAKQWSLAFAIGAENRRLARCAAGFSPFLA